MAVVALVAVQAVMQALGEREELGVPLDHQPSGRQADSQSERQQDVEHLGHAPAARCGVDVDDLGAVQLGFHARDDALLQSLQALLGDHDPQIGQSAGLEIDLEHARTPVAVVHMQPETDRHVLR